MTDKKSTWRTTAAQLCLLVALVSLLAAIKQISSRDVDILSEPGYLMGSMVLPVTFGGLSLYLFSRERNRLGK